MERRRAEMRRDGGRTLRRAGEKGRYDVKMHRLEQPKGLPGASPNIRTGGPEDSDLTHA